MNATLNVWYKGYYSSWKYCPARVSRQQKMPLSLLWGVLKSTCRSLIWCWPLPPWSESDLHTTINSVRKNRLKHALCCHGAPKQPLAMNLPRTAKWIWLNCSHSVQLPSYLSVSSNNFNSNSPDRCWGASERPILYWFWPLTWQVYNVELFKFFFSFYLTLLSPQLQWQLCECDP